MSSQVSRKAVSALRQLILPSGPATAGNAGGGKSRRRRNRRRGAGSAPLANGFTGRTAMPVFGGGRNSITVTHREFLCDIIGGPAFGVTSYQVNPGLSLTFPWLHPIARNFESYTFKTLRFIYEPTVPATAAGAVILSFDFDAADSPPRDKQAALSYAGAVRTNVWNSAVMECNKLDLKKMALQRYTRSGRLSANLDIKTYDVGSVSCSTYGGSELTTVGELYVEYVVELQTPEVDLDAELTAESARVKVPDCGVDLSLPLEGATIDGGLPLGLTSNSIIFPEVGKYLVDLYLSGTNITGAPSKIAVNCTTAGEGAVTTGGVLKEEILVNTTSPGASLGLSMLGKAAALATLYLRVVPYQTNLG